ncbi:uncharacterized protein LOC144130207 [Amblyomma americanum]
MKSRRTEGMGAFPGAPRGKGGSEGDLPSSRLHPRRRRLRQRHADCHQSAAGRPSKQGSIMEPQRILRAEHHDRHSGYPLEPQLLTPVSGHPDANTAEGQYNAAHASMRCVVEHCIGVLKSRFRCLQRYRTLHYEPERTVVITAACAALHDICLEEALGADEDPTTDEPGNNGPPLLAGYLAGTGSRMTYLRGRAMRDRIIGLFGTTRPQRHAPLQTAAVATAAATPAAAPPPAVSSTSSGSCGCNDPACWRGELSQPLLPRAVPLPSVSA